MRVLNPFSRTLAPIPRQVAKQPSSRSARALRPSQCRQFNIFNSASDSNTPRLLTETRTLPYPRSSIFKVIASVDKYQDFLPFLNASTVLSRDAKGWPSRATLSVGYDGGPMNVRESFTSKVRCDEGEGIVEARCGGGEGAEDELFEYLKTKWTLRESEEGREDSMVVDLGIEVRFKSMMYEVLMGSVEDKVAGIMIGAFEKRVKEVCG